VSCQLHKRGMNFPLLLRNSVKRYPALLQTQVLACSDQIIALMILACRDNYNYMAQYIVIVAITSTCSMGTKKGKAQSSHTAPGEGHCLVWMSPSLLPAVYMGVRFSLSFACCRVLMCCVFAFVGNLRGFNMTAPALQQFFPQATRHSLLGPPPVGVSLKPTRLGFPNLPFQRQNRMFRKVGSKLRTILGFRAPFALRVVDCIVDKEEGERREPYSEFAPCYWQRNGETSPSLRFLLSVFTFRMQRFLVCICPGQIISHSRTV